MINGRTALAFAAGSLTAVLAIGQFGAGTSEGQPGRISKFEIVQAKEIRLVDAAGNTTARLLTDAAGGSLRVFDAAGALLGSLPATPAAAAPPAAGAPPASPAGTPQPPVTAAPAWQDKARWAKLTRNISAAAVRELLGEPTDIHKGSWGEQWIYGGDTLQGSVSVSSGGVVTGWTEPIWPK